IKVWDGVLVVPLIGILDSKRAQHLTEELLTSIAATQSKIAIIDITGVPTVDSAVANHLVKTIESVNLLGAACVVTGIKPDVAQTVIHLGIDITKLETKATLAEGLKWAFRSIGLDKGVSHA
ncbi:STAS domain-containing protein, partial [candidate division WOR-3 bacterium]|nr:STAS domain-containing protein [candidate division WOR-3 bacterium]